MNSELTKFRDELEALAADLIRPELLLRGASAAYCVLQSESNLESHGLFLGMTSPLMGQWLESEIGCRWAGDGPTMLLNDFQIMESRDHDFDLALGLWHAVFCHEMAHIILTKKLFWSREDVSDPPEVTGKCFREAASSKEPVPELCGQVVTAFAHPAKFIRVALHIAWRMEQRGFYVPLSCLVCWGDGPVSGSFKYRAALGAECQQMADMPLSAVSHSPLPEEFEELWLRDIDAIFELDENDRLIPKPFPLDLKENAMSLFRKLSARKSERQKESASEWSEFVTAVSDERVADADEILDELSRLQKSQEDLQAACELLAQRRVWAAQVAAGDQAESEHASLQDQKEAAEIELDSVVAAHREKHRPLGVKIVKAQSDIAAGHDAVRRLKETASVSACEAAFSELDAEMAAVQKERQPLTRSIADRERWVAGVTERGSTADEGDRSRLTVMRDGLRDMLERDAGLRDKLDDLRQQRDAAEAHTLRADAI